MRSTPSLRIMAAALLAGGALAVATTGTTAVADDRGDRAGIECQFRGQHFNDDPFWHWCPDFDDGSVNVNVIVIVAG
ncbi:hypothetical protein AB5J55_21670 [Streptomyces sp. R11]|uniref:Uncharacterized protein n=1 Tax=Streptomyces sp. R11 TaxID=3238625 RepID=A0AB39N2T9_9ACTN